LLLRLSCQAWALRCLHARKIVLLHRILPHHRAPTGTTDWIGQLNASAGTHVRPPSRCNKPLRRLDWLRLHRCIRYQLRPGPIPATDGAPMSLSPGDSAPPSPHVKILAVKPTSAQGITATADKLAERNVQEGNTAPSMIEAPTPQASTSTQTSAQAAGPASVPPVTWPDAPPAVAAVHAQAPVAIPTDAPRMKCPSMQRGLPGAVSRPTTPGCR
jgi:hypothetical protein